MNLDNIPMEDDLQVSIKPSEEGEWGFVAITILGLDRSEIESKQTYIFTKDELETLSKAFAEAAEKL